MLNAERFSDTNSRRCVCVALGVEEAAQALHDNCVSRMNHHLIEVKLVISQRGLVMYRGLVSRA